MGYQPPKDSASGQDPQPILSEKDLRSYFEKGYKKPEDVRIGMEVEKNGIRRSNYKPISYLEAKGVRSVQEKLIEELNWVVDREEGKYITSMSRGESRLTLEYCESMTELSGRTHSSIHDLARELRIHQHELSEISRIFDIAWLGIGYQPFSGHHVFQRAKLNRFNVLEDFFKKKSKNWVEHWHRLCSIQANIDYTSEDDARRKFQILLRLSPFLSAMYAHSPIKEGKNTGYVSYRTHLLRKIDPRRFGIRKIFFSPHFGFNKWIEFAKRVPMVAIFRDGNWIPVKGMNFAQFLKSGYEKFTPTAEDFTLHLSFLYSDIRIKQYIELRICDSLPPFLIPSLQAIVKGFVYHKDGDKLMRDLTKDWNFSDFASIYQPIALAGMHAEHKGKKLLDYCKEILNIATANLRSFGVMNEKNEDESVYLQPIKEFVFMKEKSPGRWVMENWDGEWRQNPEKLIEWCSYETMP